MYIVWSHKSALTLSSNLMYTVWSYKAAHTLSSNLMCTQCGLSRQHTHYLKPDVYTVGPHKAAHTLSSNLMHTITKQPLSDMMYDNITEFGVAEDHLSPQGESDPPPPQMK